MRKWEIGKYTLNQLINALSEPKKRDPHEGGRQIMSLDEISA